MHGQGGMCGEGGHVWQRAACIAKGDMYGAGVTCVAEGVCVAAGGMHGRGDMHGRGYVWHAGGMQSGVHAWQRGACIAKWGHAWRRGMCCRGHAWWGACMAGGSVRGRRDGHCSRRYASYWNAFMLIIIFKISPLMFLFLPIPEGETNLVFGKVFAKNCMKMKVIEPKGRP